MGDLLGLGSDGVRRTHGGDEDHVVRPNVPGTFPSHSPARHSGCASSGWPRCEAVGALRKCSRASSGRPWRARPRREPLRPPRARQAGARTISSRRLTVPRVTVRALKVPGPGGGDRRRHDEGDAACRARLRRPWMALSASHTSRTPVDGSVAASDHGPVDAIERVVPTSDSRAMSSGVGQERLGVLGLPAVGRDLARPSSDRAHGDCTIRPCSRAPSGSRVVLVKRPARIPASRAG